MVDAIVTQTLSHDRSLAQAIRGRIRAVSLTNDVVAASSDMTADLQDLLSKKFAEFAAIRISGPEVRVPSDVARNLSLIFHELRTNAIKYGSLSCKEGSVKVSWIRSGNFLRFAWEEEGGPVVQQPCNTGFGTRLIKTIVASLGGTISLNYEPSGFTAAFSIKLANKAS